MTSPRFLCALMALTLLSPHARSGEVGVVPGPGRKEPPRREVAYPEDPSARENGRLLFTRFNCAGCHGDHGGGGMGPSLRDQDWIYGSTSRDIFDSIAEGRAHGMPAWGPLLPPEFIWQLVSYIKSLRTPREAQAPG